MVPDRRERAGELPPFSVVAARLQLTLATVLVLVAAALAVVLLTRDTTHHALVGADGWAGSLRPPGIPPQNFALRDEDGKTISLRSYRGQVVVLTFLYTHCQDSCPVTAQTIRGAMDQLGHDVPALAVTVDPANDTQAAAQSFLIKQSLSGGRMHFLLGTEAQVSPVWKDYGIQPQTKTRVHSDYVILIDRRGRQRIGFPNGELTPEGLAHDIRRLSAERA